MHYEAPYPVLHYNHHAHRGNDPTCDAFCRPRAAPPDALWIGAEVERAADHDVALDAIGDASPAGRCGAWPQHRSRPLLDGP
eukprot:6209556-Pleurochrysis_carterae.AAC.6